ncbi:MAG: hypothetical protein ACP5D0_08065 [Hydrogenovibrio sp.]
MGFLHEAIAMSARHQRCRNTWQPHFEQCQSAIRRAVNACRTFRQVVILGAGSLNDIPLGFLSQTFEAVTLVDMVFLKPARRLAAEFDNVFLLEADVSGCLAEAQGGNALVKAPVLAGVEPEKVDCVVSLNLATQLPLIPVRWLMERFALPETKADTFGKDLIQAHLDYLDGFSGVKCLIADRDMREYDCSGHLTDQWDPAWGVRLPAYDQAWDWEVIPLGESSDNRAVCQRNRVGVSIW